MNHHSPLRILQVTFDTPIKAYELHYFRAGIAHKVGLEHDWFHNHNNQENEESNFIHRYPLIQYQFNNNRPMMLFLGDCVEEAHKFFSKADWTIKIKDRLVPLRIHRLHVHEHHFQVAKEKLYHAKLYRWLALNYERNKHYEQLPYLSDRILLLEEALKGHIQSFLLGVGYQHNEMPLIAKIGVINNTHKEMYKRQPQPIRIKSFDIEFFTNIKLPDMIGLGKGSTRGFGTFRYFAKKNK